MDLENPDRECNNCGASDWRKVREATPRHYGENSEVVQHLYACKECDADARIYEDGGNLRCTAAMR